MLNSILLFNVCTSTLLQNSSQNSTFMIFRRKKNSWNQIHIRTYIINFFLNSFKKVFVKQISRRILEMNFKHGVCVHHLKGGCHTHFTSENHMSFVHHSRYLILFVSKYTFYLPPLYFKIYYIHTNIIKAYFNQNKMEDGVSWVFLEGKN